MRRWIIPGSVALLWLVLLAYDLIASVQQAKPGTDVLSQLFSGPSALMSPVRKALLIASQSLPGAGGQLFAGLSIGDTSRVSEDLSSAMKTASMTHLVAVSGANCHVVTATTFVVLSWLGAPRWMRISGAILTLLLFVALVTPGASIARAAVMSLAVLTGLALGRMSAGIPVLSLAVGGLLILNPSWAINYGFVLSVLATLGLLLLTEPISKFFSRWMARWLATALAVPLAASLLCQPVIILLSPRLPTYGVLANLLAVPAAGVVTILGLLACIAAAVFMPLAVILAWMAWLPSEWIGRVAQVTAGLPFSSLAWPSGAVGLFLAAALSLSVVVVIVRNQGPSRQISLWFGVLVLGSSVVWTIGSASHAVAAVPRAWLITACDIGQGDAVLLRGQEAGGEYQTALIDTGRTPAGISACLTRMNISHLNLLVLTHFDLDHVGGASALIGKVDRVILGQPVDAHEQQLRSELCTVDVLCEIGVVGMTGNLGEAKWQVIWPDGKTPEMQSGNPGSISMLVRWPNLSAAFVGDLGAAAQDALLASTVDIPRVDVLKVAHHGSADTSEALVSRFHPKIALISVGVDNGYGHPTHKALSMLEALGTVIGRTDKQGFLFVSVDGERLRFDTDR